MRLEDADAADTTPGSDVESTDDDTTADAFLERMPHVARLTETAFDTAELDGEHPLVVVPAAP